VTELQHAFALTEPDIVVADRAFAELVEAAGGPATRVCVDHDVPAGWLSFWELIFSSSGRRPASLPISALDDDVALPFSSGTTGLPKAVRHTHRTLVAAMINWKSAATIGEDDRLQFFLPLFHIYGIATTACAFGAGATLTLFPRFDLDTMLSHIEEARVTIGFGAAPIAVAMANHPELEKYDLSSLRYFLWAATPVARDVADRVTERAGVRWVQGYGATEAPGLYCNPIRYPEHCRLDSPGLPVSDLEVRIVDLETHDDVEPGAEGEIVVRGPHVMAGYLPPEANDDAFLEGGWLRTGDVGWLEPEGWLHITDRAKEMIKVSGFAVAPAELEAMLHSHPAVGDCGVYGVPDDRRGEVPKAAVVLTAPGAATEEGLCEWIAERLATYKHIDRVVFVDEIPRTASGKVLRRTLKENDPEAVAAS
jgi:acyl-CoA synthetase (AMP-forming)/AMP-acid ligase II